LLVFGRAYPKFELVVTSTDAEPEFTREFNGAAIRFMTLGRLVHYLTSQKLADDGQNRGNSVRH
jgi:hypothetical protein